jgi:HSP20 family molecular chaperone IbpA
MSTTNKNTLAIGLIALAAGVAIGIGGTRVKAEMTDTGHAANAGTNQLSNTVLPDANLNATADPFQDIRNMQLQMDRMFGQMSDQFRAEPQFSGPALNPGYSLSLNTREFKDHYEVTAYLPDARAADVNVKLANDRTLRVDVSNHENQSVNHTNLVTSVADWGQYEEVIQLPSPVKAAHMKIERKDHELYITLPKA